MTKGDYSRDLDRVAQQSGAIPSLWGCSYTDRARALPEKTRLTDEPLVIQTAFFAIACYSLGALLQWRSFTDRTEIAPRWIRLLGLTGLVAQTLHLRGLILTPLGIDLGLFHVVSAVAASMVLMTLAASLREPMDNLFILILPLTALSTLLGAVLKSPYQPFPTPSPGLTLHIISSVLAYSLLAVAAFQALLLAFQNRQLKARHGWKLLRHLPPLETMEKLLFQLIRFGLLLLTLAIVSGALSLENLFAQHLAHKTILSLIAWCIFAALLWGRHRFGWRGSTAVRWTLFGFLALMLAFYGSKLVLELILHRPNP